MRLKRGEKHIKNYSEFTLNKNYLNIDLCFIISIYRICTKCNTIKEISNFGSRKNRRYNRRSICLYCDSIYRYKRSCEKRDDEIKYKREWNKKNKDKVKGYGLKRRDISLKYQKEYYQANKEKIAKRNKANYEKTKKKKFERSKQYKKENPSARLRSSLISRVKAFLNGKNKSISTIEMIGCSIEYLKKHLESQFTKGMKWDNYGLKGWHLDHIIPCSKFDLTKEDEQKQCFHYCNLRPMWAKENISKSNKLIPELSQLKLTI